MKSRGHRTVIFTLPEGETFMGFDDIVNKGKELFEDAKGKVERGLRGG